MCIDAVFQTCPHFQCLMILEIVWAFSGSIQFIKIPKFNTCGLAPCNASKYIPALSTLILQGEQIMPASFKCPKCDRSFGMAAHLARHMNTKHAAGARRGAQPQPGNGR